MSEHPNNAVLPPEVIEAFSSSAVIALQELAHCEAVRGGQTTSCPTFPDHAAIAAMQLLRRLPGTLTLILPAEVASHVAQSYLPEGAELTQEIIDDVVGEFANVIAGQAKTMLKGTPYHFTLSLPVVARSPQQAETAGAALVLTTAAGPMWLVLELAPCPGA
jgi:CheY-specific phosphatase CheX